jgi:hypothetical protein
MTKFAHIGRCVDLSEADIAAATGDRASLRALLQRMAEVARPGEGAAKVLLVFARMASTACDWLDGDLSVELVGDATTTIVDLLTDLGGGLRERVVPSAVLAVPLKELTLAVDRMPQVILPLSILSRTERRIVLGATASIRRSSLPAPLATMDALEVPFPLPPRVAERGPATRTASPRIAPASATRTLKASELPAPREPSLRPAPVEPEVSGDADEPRRR